MNEVTSPAPFDARQLDQLAELCVKLAVNLQAGQELVMNAPVEAMPLVRRITEHAYRAGASLVTPLLTDPEIALARFQHGRGAAFDRAPGWLYDGMGQALDNGAALAAIIGTDPMLMADQDPDHVGRVSKASAFANKPVQERISGFDTNWSILAWPGRTWARRVFPEMPADQAAACLANEIVAAARLESDDPIATWQAHADALRHRCDWLNTRRFDALHFRGPDTDLRVGLADDHMWMGGAMTAGNSVPCIPNIPTEEVFTNPHAARVDGHVRATKPLSHMGTLIDDIQVRVEAGRIVEARASRGEAVLQSLLDSDEGARRLGEVALVPHSSPISRSGLLFYNTLFDENAACHIALGQCLSRCFRDAASLSRAEITERGGNSSAIHIDWMIGSDEIDIDGIHSDGRRTPVFRGGEWAD